MNIWQICVKTPEDPELHYYMGTTTSGVPHFDKPLKFGFMSEEAAKAERKALADRLTKGNLDAFDVVSIETQKVSC